jgi:hypothetical protein
MVQLTRLLEFNLGDAFRRHGLPCEAAAPLVLLLPEASRQRRHCYQLDAMLLLPYDRISKSCWNRTSHSCGYQSSQYTTNEQLLLFAAILHCVSRNIAIAPFLSRSPSSSATHPAPLQLPLTKATSNCRGMLVGAGRALMMWSISRRSVRFPLNIDHSNNAWMVAVLSNATANTTAARTSTVSYLHTNSRIH